MLRDLTESERRLITKILADSNCEQSVLNQLSSAQVIELNDGGMGSLRFAREDGKKHRLGKTVSQAEFVDEDGVTVSVTINLDEDGYLFELDVWKVDFSPLKRWPRSKDIVVKM